jgi:hypothetical protein
LVESFHVTRHLAGWQVSVAHWRHNKVSDQAIGVSQCLRNTASVRAVSNIELGGDFLMHQGNQSITADWLVQN